MARLRSTRWLVGFLFAVGLTAIISAQPATAPAEQKLWPMRTIHGVERVDVRDLAERFGLKAEWTRLGLTMVLKDAHGPRLIFEARQQDIHFDGLRIFLGQPVLPDRDSLWVSLLDVIKIVAPLLDPKVHADKLPAGAPKTIVIDPGHGGGDPGTHNALFRVWEKDMTLDVALRLRPILEARGWKVIMIRDKDIELSRDKKMDLLMRDELANRSKADVYLSIHFNDATLGVTGIETYALAPQFMLSAGNVQGDDMTKVAYPANHFDLANLFLGEKVHRAMIDGLKSSDRGFKHARWAVLRMLECPGILVECGYLSNNSETRLIATPEHRQKIAEALAAGLQDYATAIASLHPAPPPPKVPPVLMPPTRPVTAPSTRPSR